MFPSVSCGRFATSRSLPILVLAALAPLWLAPTGAEAAWPQDPYNGNVPLCQAAGDQVNEVSASDGAGGVIVAWQDRRNGSNNDIYAQHGNVSVFSLVAPSGVTAVEGSTLPPWPRIAGIAPNPAHREAAIQFALPREEPATLVVFDPAGRRVRQLASGTMAAGEHLARWDGRDDAGGVAPSGLYFVRLVAAGRIATARLALLR